MKLTWVNHASFIVDTHDVRLICDPWIEGRVFNRGWSLLSPSKLTYQDFQSITHIFISHQHPDHFSPPNLRKIPEKIRRNITVLFHETKDKRVLRYCRAIGFKSIELPPNRCISLAKGTQVLCCRRGLLDSWVAVRSEGRVLLNLNDCVFFPAALGNVRKLTGEVDVLLTQFSYANWVGNRGDRDAQRAAAKRKIREIKNQLQVIRPKTYVPCASFVWFSHEENYYLNEGSNRISDIHNYTTRDLATETVVLYPGDQWNVGDAHDSQSALKKYDTDYLRITHDPELAKTRKVSFEDLQYAEQSFRRKVQHRNPRLMVRALPPAVAFIHDLGIHVRISLSDSMRVVHDSEFQPDIVLAAESLYYCFLHDWGGDALAVNGRYQVPPKGSPRKFFRIFQVALVNSTGQQLSLTLVMKRAFQLLRRTINV